jgi:hypothetical protein
MRLRVRDQRAAFALSDETGITERWGGKWGGGGGCWKERLLEMKNVHPEPEAHEPRSVSGEQPVVHLPPRTQESAIAVTSHPHFVIDYTEPKHFRMDEDGRLLLTEQSNAFIEVIKLPDGGVCARLRADPEHLVGDGETVEEALANLGKLCARLYAYLRRHEDAPETTPPQKQPAPSAPSWSYRRKTADEIKTLAAGMLDGTIHFAHGQEAIERDWPVMVKALRDHGINESMNRAGVVAFFEEVAKASLLKDGRRVFLTCDTLDMLDYARFLRAIEASRPASDSRLSTWAKIGAKVAEPIVRTPTAVLRQK